jgi:hypothetical protein
MALELLKMAVDENVSNRAKLAAIRDASIRRACAAKCAVILDGFESLSGTP